MSPERLAGATPAQRLPDALIRPRPTLSATRCQPHLRTRSADLRGFRLLLGRGKRAPYLGLLGAWASPRYREMQHRGGDIGDHETWGSERYFSAFNDPAILTYYPPRSSNFPST